MHLQQHNPLLEYPDPFKEINENLKKMHEQNPLAQEMPRLCYELLIKNEDGKALWELLKETVLMRNFVDPNSSLAMQNSFWYEAFKEAYRVLYRQALEHKKRIESHGNG